MLAAATALAPEASAVPRRAQPLPTGPSPLEFAAEPVPGTWRIRWSLRNVGAAPVEVAADRRLVWVEVPPPPAPPGARRPRRAPKPVRCVHEARPADPFRAAQTTLNPGQRYSELVDLRDLCRLRVPAAVTAGASVVAHYGFDPPAGRRLTAARWRARTVVLDERPYPVNDLAAPVTLASLPEARAPEQAVRAVTVAARDAQAATGQGLRVGVTLRNGTGRPVWTLWQTSLFSFEMETPSGRAVTCDVLTRDVGTFRDLFARLPAGGRRSTRLAVYEYCPLGAFDEAGLYRVRAVFRSTADGSPWLQGGAFTGRVVSEPFTLRVSRGRERYRPFGLEVSG